jgi:hypothetical protein
VTAPEDTNASHAPDGKQRETRPPVTAPEGTNASHAPDGKQREKEASRERD